ncbi:MAG TPA: hypothetical protein VNO17_11205 [Actinomycetota bacterium]|nr:hypothetical protein [Actinomycetota bacterium]
MAEERELEEIRGFFAGRIPEGWFTGPPDVDADRDEILVVGTLPQPEVAEGASAEEVRAAREARIGAFREDTRERRIRIALAAERRFRRKVSWGVRCGDVERMFTTYSAPAMTRLRMSERRVLDTLVDAGVARSRSHALAWCVRLVAERQEEWLKDLREALVHVEEARSRGPRG